MFRQLEYQDRVLTTFDSYLNCLKEKKNNADEVAKHAIQNPELSFPVPDFARETWEALKDDGNLPISRINKDFSPRTDGCERPVPNVVFKVPTGGGKTWLAVLGISKIMGQYLSQNVGFVLWVVPNEAIYAQTLKHLRDRQHPYRQALDRAAMGRVRILEKTDRLDARDVEVNLCVMLLMLQSANRETKDSLKIFKDRGDVYGFLPPEGEQQLHKKIFEDIPNLDIYNDMFLPVVKDSLGNALRIIRPVVVLDEGHRAISDLAFKTLYGFNPSFVLELTATPQDIKARGGKNPREARNANILVEITGRDLDREGMVKMPLNLDSKQGTDWKATLNVALGKLKSLESDAEKFRADTNRYIRPIMLVQVERTGSDQREVGLIHAEDVKEWFLNVGLNEEEIAIKTAQQNDLRNPENQNLLSPSNKVRIIITKQALQEGWDCPFAYVLCSLAASSNHKAMTQLIGRILRQPEARKTGVSSLDECHVITHHAETAEIVKAVKNGLEHEGLGDLVIQVGQSEKSEIIGTAQTINRRNDFSSAEIYLPKVMVMDDDSSRELDYETDILSVIEWRNFDPKDIAKKIPKNIQLAERQFQRIRLSDDGEESEELILNELIEKRGENFVFDSVYATRMIFDIVPNSFIGMEIVDKFAKILLSTFSKDELGHLTSFIIEELREGLEHARDEFAECLFKERVEKGNIQFQLRADGRNWEMPKSYNMMLPQRPRHLLDNKGIPVQKSLFAPVYEHELNPDEQNVAVYLDGAKTLSWWHRNVARTQYGIQGWKKNKIYPDFIFAIQSEGEEKKITVLETKGEHLDNLDTNYKREVLSFLSNHFDWNDTMPAGKLALVNNSGEIVQATLILMNEWKTKLPGYLQ